MKLLALDSSGNAASVALIEGDVLKAEYTIDHKKTHSQTLLPMLDELKKMTEFDPETVDAIAVAAGPGSFTGLRIGSATAKGLGLALNKPIVSVPTTEGLAYNLYGHNGLICPIMDARREQVYTGLYGFISTGGECGTGTIDGKPYYPAAANPREWYFRILEQQAEFLNGLVDSSGEDAHIAVLSGTCQLVECLHHTGNGSQEANHWCACGSSGEPVESFLHFSDFHVSHVLDSHEHVVHGSSNARHALLYHARVGGVGVGAQLFRLINFSCLDEVLDLLHEVVVGLCHTAGGK